MTTLQEKAEARRQGWIRAEAQRIANAIEVQQIVSLVTPNMEDKMRKWVAEEVARGMKEVRAQVIQDMKDHVKGEVATYCRSVFDSQMDDDHFHMVQEAPPDNDPLPELLGMPKSPVIKPVSVDSDNELEKGEITASLADFGFQELEAELKVLPTESDLV